LSATYNLVCKQANTFNFQFQIKNDTTPWNLTGYTATMTVRPFLGASTTILVATTANGLITLQGGNGKATVNVSSDTTATYIPGRYVYDFVFDSGETVTTVLEGQFIVTAGATV
jgi:hypothetical protein